MFARRLLVTLTAGAMVLVGAAAGGSSDLLPLPTLPPVPTPRPTPRPTLLPTPRPQPVDDNHYVCHRLDVLLEVPVRHPLEAVRGPVRVVDQFGTRSGRSLRGEILCAPADKNDEGVADEIVHLKGYCPESPSCEQAAGGFGWDVHAVDRRVRFSNQFGEGYGTAQLATWLLVPTLKAHPERPMPVTWGPPKLDHYMCYRGTFDPPRTPRPVSLRDQFGEYDSLVTAAEGICNPASKDGEPVLDRVTHLMAYRLDALAQPAVPTVVLVNQMGLEVAVVLQPFLLLVPSTKIDCQRQPHLCQPGTP